MSPAKTVNEDRIKQALEKGPFIKDMGETDLRLELVNVVSQAYCLRSKVASIEESDFIVNVIFDELKTNYYYLAMGEIMIAVREWLYEQNSSCYFGLVPADFVRSIERYSRSEARNTVLNQLNRKKERARLPQEQIDELNHQALMSSIERFINDVRTTGHICDITNIFVLAVFDYLVSNGQLVLTNEQKNKLAKGDASIVKREILNGYYAEKIKEEPSPPTPSDTP